MLRWWSDGLVQVGVWSWLLLSLVPSAPAQERGEELFVIGRIKYGGGGDWYCDPSGPPNLLKFLREECGIATAESDEPVELSSPKLFSYHYLFITGHGNIRFTEVEVENLRKWLEAGGFIHADDCYGMDLSFRREMKRVLPGAEWVELPWEHPIYRTHFNFPQGPPKIHEHDGLPAQGLALFWQGRMVVYYTYQSDLGDGWEDPDVHNDPPEKRLAALRMGANIVIWWLRGGR